MIPTDAKRLIIIVLLAFMGLSAKSQEARESVVVYFRKESAVFEAGYKDNGIRTEAFFRKVREYQKISDFVVLKVEAIGTASPEGQLLFNEIISEKRQQSVERHILNNLDIEPQIYFSHFVSQDWDNLIKAIEADPEVTSKEKILDIIRNGGDDRLDRMLEVEYSRPYWYIYHNIFPLLRACRVTVFVDMSGALDEVVIEDTDIPCDEDFIPLQKDTVPLMKVVKVNGLRIAMDADVKEDDAIAAAQEIRRKRHDERWDIDRQLTIKSNVIGWGMSAANIAVEIDVARNWSFCLPFYYSGLDYFKETLKFRIASLQPEVRYYIPKVKGLYAGVHLGVGWFNYALDGMYRIQDAGGKRPAYGGGIGAGYRMEFKKNPRWRMEFAIGAGVYDAKYDKFYNEENGPYAERGVRKTFVGIDNAAVTFTYSFDLKRKEGGK